MTVLVDDLASRLGRTPSTAERDQWEAWLADALYLVESRYGAQFASLPAADVDYVVRTAVVEHVRNWRPSDESRVEIAVDDGRLSRSYFRASGSLVISDDLWARLDEALGVTAGGAFTVTPFFEPDAPAVSSWL